MDRGIRCKYSCLCDDFTSINPACVNMRPNERYVLCSTYRETRKLEKIVEYLEYVAEAEKWI